MTSNTNTTNGRLTLVSMVATLLQKGGLAAVCAVLLGLVVWQNVQLIELTSKSVESQVLFSKSLDRNSEVVQELTRVIHNKL